MKLLVASQNRGKVGEIKAALAETEVEIVHPADVGLHEFDVEETGSTFADNALLKAKAFSEASGLSSLADDSGLMVRSLGGAPGVYSKRFVPGTDDDRNQAMLERMEGVEDRFAEFVTVLCFLQVTETKPKIEYFEGRVTGRIHFESKGENGFGYDPIFVPDGYDKTFAQLTAAEKLSLSHRGRALEAFKSYLLKERR